MLTNEQRRCFANTPELDRSFGQVMNPVLLDCDLINNDIVCSFTEFFVAMQANNTVKELGKAVQPFHTDRTLLEFSRIAENYRDALQKLHDTTLQALKDACLAVAKEIDEEAKSRFALGDDCPHAKAAENATRRHVFGYNEKARLKRDYELREDFRHRAFKAKLLAEMEVDSEAEPNKAPITPQTALEPVPIKIEPPIPRPRVDTGKTSYLGCSSRPRRRRPRRVAAAPLVPEPLHEGPPVLQVVQEVPNEPNTDGFIDTLAHRAEAEALKAKVVLSEPEQLHIPDLTENYNRSIRKSKDPNFLIDICSEYDCHSIKRTGVEGNYTYTKTTTINTDSIHMSHP